MKCITVCEPYASAIIHGPKRVENRSRFWYLRGRVAIHAGKSRKFMGTLNSSELRQWPDYDESRLVFGYIIGTVEIYDCQSFVANRPTLSMNPWACGPYCLMLRNPIPLPSPVLWRGQLGVYEIPDELVTTLQA